MGRKHVICKKCLFFDAHDEEFGRCRRYAPRSVVVVGHGTGGYFYPPSWPRVKMEEWCGEFCPKKTDPYDLGVVSMKDLASDVLTALNEGNHSRIAELCKGVLTESPEGE